MKAAVRDFAGGRREAGEMADDRSSLQVRDDADERQAGEQPGEESVAVRALSASISAFGVSTASRAPGTVGSAGATVR